MHTGWIGGTGGGTSGTTGGGTVNYYGTGGTQTSAGTSVYGGIGSFGLV